MLHRFRFRCLIFLPLVVFSLIALGSPGLSQAQSQLPYWTEATPPTVARQELYPEVLNGKIYVVGGLLSPNTGFSAHFESYDPVQDAWTALRPIPEARHHITLSVVNGLLYGVGGFTGGFPDWRAQPTMFIYNPASNTWTGGTDLPAARAEGVSAVVDDKIYLIGRRVRATEEARLFNDHIDSVRNEVFDPTTRRWSARADAPTARNSAASAVIDGKIYAMGGRNFVRNADGTTQQVNVPNLEVYDPELDRWETRSPRLANQVDAWSSPAPRDREVTLEGNEVYTRVGENLPPL